MRCCRRVTACASRSTGSAVRSLRSIRKFVLKAARLADLVRLGSMPVAAARFLEAAVLAGQNIVVAGGTQPEGNHDDARSP